MSSTIVCICGKKFSVKKELDPEIKDDLQLRVWQHVEGTEDHSPFSWEEIQALTITTVASSAPTTSFLDGSMLSQVPLTPPVADSQVVQATQVGDASSSSKMRRLENLETVVAFMGRGLIRLAEDMMSQKARNSCRSRSRSR